MNIYRMVGNTLGTPDAIELAERLSAWHDQMVTHERLARLRDACSDECPHVEAAGLWHEAREMFGEQAAELRFLRSRSGAAQPARA